MTRRDDIFKKIAESLLVDYSSVYYVNAVTNEYFWYSVDPAFHSLSLEQGGDDFFKNIIRDCKQVIFKEDQHIFIEDIQKENLLAAMEKGSMQNIEYRLMIDGVPTWHSLRVIRGPAEDSDYFILGVINIDEEYHRRQLQAETSRQKELYNQILNALAGQYDLMFYVDLEDSSYTEIASTAAYKRMNIPGSGKDFFAENRKNARNFVHPEDQDMVVSVHYKDTMLKNLSNSKSFSIEYRFIFNERVIHVRQTEIMAADRKHIIVCIKNIEADVRAKLELMDKMQKSLTYTQIAESLASHYDMIYYVNAQTSHYKEFSTHKLYGELEISEEGDDFFSSSEQNVDRIIHPEDRERMKLFINKDNLITQLDGSLSVTQDYRMTVGNGEPQYTSMTVSWSSDKTHLIVCIENREAYVKKEQEHIRALNMANETARRDSLTGTRNITAFHEYETDLKKAVDEKTNDPFGIAVCDLNDLKIINDTRGHKAGDDYIRAACKLICLTFAHSPVFRIGGDEFAIFLKGEDYKDRNILIASFRKQVEENMRIESGPVVAIGVAEYEPEKEETLDEIFKIADGRMYEDKARLKELKLLHESHALKKSAGSKTITDDRKKMLDTLFKSYEVVSEGTYVYLCDMKFDLSRWSKNAIDTYGLPSEYMYAAGDIWENCIHPDDREAYRKGIDEIFAGNSFGHDMQYRARNINGEYDVCTCRGVVIRDGNGEPDYFVGTIRNHGSQGHIDTLTGLRNQYGFFDDLNSWIKRKAAAYVIIVGISKFSEINEVYGYHFGNRVLQLFARKVFESTSSNGTCYRIDGTKFAIITNSMSADELIGKYTEFRNYFREIFQVDDKRILLEVNGGALLMDHFDIDPQTVYACLNYAYSESKTRRQGDLIMFENDLNENNRHRLEKLHKIRASITHGYRGFYLLFQPVVDANTEELISAEALIRWKNDEYGIVPPDQFLPLLESDPLFPELGEWIIKEAVIVAKKQLKKNPDFVININLSYTQLEKPDFVDMVFRILDDIGYPADHLCFEVTERCKLLDIKLLRNVTASLKARGILIALDDFGTGFSSIGIVKELPFDIIKIDKSFVSEIEEENLDRKLIKTIADLAMLFGARICAEGIETEGMRDILREYAIESFQGYYYAKPLPSGEFLRWKDNRG